MVILLFGPPGCGKGTQSERIAAQTGYPAISTGSMLRDACCQPTDEAAQLREVLESGGLADDDTVNRVLLDRITENDCSAGFLLDGYPRTVEQARFLDSYLQTGSLGPPLVIHLDVAPEQLISRIASRRQCPRCSRVYNLLHRSPRQVGVCDEDGAALILRPDDDEAVVSQRMRAYRSVTDPLIAYYEGSGYVRLDGERAPHEVAAEIEKLLIERGAATETTANVRRRKP